MKQWKKYVGYDQSEQKYVGLEAAHPGPVYNAALLIGDSVTMIMMLPKSINFKYEFILC